MDQYVAFLRGINVGGNKLIKMESLRQVFESLGFTNVWTYIASGNIVFDARANNAGAIKTKIEKELKDSLGHQVTVALLTFADLASIVKADPFAGIEASKDVGLYVAFLSSPATLRPRLPLTFPKENVEVLALQDRAVFIVVQRKPDGTFAFPNDFIEKQFGVVATTRNWNTVRKIVEAGRKKGPQKGTKKS